MVHYVHVWASVCCEFKDSIRWHLLRLNSQILCRSWSLYGIIPYLRNLHKWFEWTHAFLFTPLVSTKGVFVSINCLTLVL